MPTPTRAQADGSGTSEELPSSETLSMSQVSLDELDRGVMRRLIWVIEPGKRISTVL